MNRDTLNSRVLLFLACLLLSIVGAFAQAELTAHSQQDPTKQIVDREVAALMKMPGYTAVSGAIYLKGKVYAFHYGQLGNGHKPNNETIYEIGSITKTYTGLLLSQAVHDGKIDLDADVRKYLDGKYPNLVLHHGQAITFRHLITHTAGLPATMNCEGEGQSTEEQVACFARFRKKDFFEALKKVKLIDSLGENYHYSGVGIQLVGYILEQVYQMPFESLLQRYIFLRSGEKQTVSELEAMHPNVSIGKNSKGKAVPLINGFYKYSGGLKSSVASMANYMKMYLESPDPVVKQALKRLAGNVQYGRAYAWNTYNDDQEMRMLYHNGSSFGHSSWMALYPNQKVGIFIVTNVVTPNSQAQLNDLSNRIIDQLKIRGK